MKVIADTIDPKKVVIQNIQVYTRSFPSPLTGKNAKIITSLAEQALFRNGDMEMARKASEILTPRYQKHMEARIRHYQILDRLSSFEELPFADTPTYERHAMKSLRDSFHNLPFRSSFSE